jgi:hypothetical protein
MFGGMMPLFFVNFDIFSTYIHTIPYIHLSPVAEAPHCKYKLSGKNLPGAWLVEN